MITDPSPVTIIAFAVWMLTSFVFFVARYAGRQTLADVFSVIALFSACIAIPLWLYEWMGAIT
ncbi:hypothetical protein [Nesterenkonia suensis]